MYDYHKQRTFYVLFGGGGGVHTSPILDMQHVMFSRLYLFKRRNIHRREEDKKNYTTNDTWHWFAKKQNGVVIDTDEKILHSNQADR